MLAGWTIVGSQGSTRSLPSATRRRIEPSEMTPVSGMRAVSHAQRVDPAAYGARYHLSRCRTLDHSSWPSS